MLTLHAVPLNRITCTKPRIYPQRMKKTHTRIHEFHNKKNCLRNKCCLVWPNRINPRLISRYYICHRFISPIPSICPNSWAFLPAVFSFLSTSSQSTHKMRKETLNVVPKFQATTSRQCAINLSGLDVSKIHLTIWPISYAGQCLIRNGFYSL